MPRKKYIVSSDSGTDQELMRPALTPEARENQMIALAIDCAEKQLRDGTASSQVITHFLKLGTIKARLELDMLQEEKKLIKAKTDNLESAKRTEELYANAIRAMKVYSGNADDGEESDDDY